MLPKASQKFQPLVSPAFPSGTKYDVQGSVMRAPEVYRGLPCTYASQVWACAAMLLGWLKPGILGPHGVPGNLMRNSWCVAKLKRLFPDWNDPPIDDLFTFRKANFIISEMWLKQSPPILKAILPLEEEMERMGLLPELRDVLRLMFVTDPEKRPTAAQVLASGQLRALNEAVSRMEYY
jgi:serine/threonine protein kinase